MVQPIFLFFFSCSATIANDAMANYQCCTQFCVYDFDLNSVDIGPKNGYGQKKKKSACLIVYHKRIYSL